MKTILQYQDGPRAGESSEFSSPCTTIDKNYFGHDEGTIIVRIMYWDQNFHLGPVYVCRETKIF